MSTRLALLAAFATLTAGTMADLAATSGLELRETRSAVSAMVVLGQVARVADGPEAGLGVYALTA